LSELFFENELVIIFFVLLDVVTKQYNFGYRLKAIVKPYLAAALGFAWCITPKHGENISSYFLINLSV
jgi:hypothetical protein